MNGPGLVPSLKGGPGGLESVWIQSCGNYFGAEIPPIAIPPWRRLGVLERPGHEHIGAQPCLLAGINWNRPLHFLGDLDLETKSTHMEGTSPRRLHPHQVLSGLVL